MLNVCLQCGLYRADKEIDPSGPYAICPECGHKQPFRRLPLLVISGASGTGKSTVCDRLMGRIDEVVLLEADILWQPEYTQPNGGHRRFYETWLRVAKNISQAGRPVALVNAGMGVPENLEECVERRYFAEIHRLALTCGDGELAARLHARPQWRNCGDPAYVQAHVDYNRWFRENGDASNPPIELLDTTGVSIEATAGQVASWIREVLRLPVAQAGPTLRAEANRSS